MVLIAGGGDLEAAILEGVVTEAEAEAAFASRTALKSCSGPSELTEGTDGLGDLDDLAGEIEDVELASRSSAKPVSCPADTQRSWLITSPSIWVSARTWPSQ